MLSFKKENSTRLIFALIMVTRENNLTTKITQTTVLWISNKFSRLCSIVITVHPHCLNQILNYLNPHLSELTKRLDFFMNFIIHKMVAIL